MLCSDLSIKTTSLAAEVELASYLSTMILLPLPTGSEVSSFAAAEPGPSRIAARAVVLGLAAYAASKPLPMPDLEPVTRTVVDMLFIEEVILVVEGVVVVVLLDRVLEVWKKSSNGLS